MDKKKPIYLLANDIHASKDNIRQFELNWEEMLDVAAKRSVEAIIIGGDLWQSRSAQSLSTLMAVRDAVLDARETAYLAIAAGNHCKVDQEDAMSYSHVFQHYRNVGVIDNWESFAVSDNCELWVISYFPENGSFQERLEQITAAMDKDKTNILYCHEGIRGGLSQSSDDELPAAIFKDFDKVLVGHYHDRKRIKGTNIEYIGASRQHNFGEDEEKGYTIVYDDGTTEFVKNEANDRFKVIEADFAELAKDEFIKSLEALKSDHRYRIKLKIKCDSAQASTVDKVKLAEMGASKVEMVTESLLNPVSAAEDISRKFDKSGIKEEYANFCAQRDITNVELGLQYLDKIN